MPLTKILVGSGFSNQDDELIDLSNKLPILTNSEKREVIEGIDPNLWDIGALNPKNLYQYLSELPYFIYQFSVDPKEY